MKHHVIYVPGLGDHRAKAQRLVTGYWRIYGVEGRMFVMNWRDKEPFAPKLNRLLRLVDELAEDGGKVSLVGTSAGASAALNAYAARLDKIAGIVCICGKINHPETIRPKFFIENPAFKESLAELQRTLPKLGPSARARVMSIRPLRDGSVPPADTVIPGAQGAVIPTVGHAFSIGMTLVFGAYNMMRFLRRQANR